MPKKRITKNGWKEIQIRKQLNKKTKWALIFVTAILGLVILGKATNFVKAIFTPWQSSDTKRTYLWQGSFNINLLIKAKNVALLSYSPKNQQIHIMELPSNSYLEVAHGYGRWELRSIFDLGGDKLLKDTMVNLLGLPLDGYLRFTDKYSQYESQVLLEQLRKDPFVLVGLLSYLKTDLTPFELFRLKIGLSSIRFDKIKRVDLAELFAEEKLADGSQVLVPDQIKLDSKISQLIEPILQSEHKTIAIFNNTDYPLLAQKAARMVTNIGGDVIITSNGQNKLAKTVVIGEKSQTLDRLRQIFGSGGTIDPKLEDLVSSRAQINIFLGEDYVKSL